MINKLRSIANIPVIDGAGKVISLGASVFPVACGMAITTAGGALWWFFAYRWFPAQHAGYFVATLGLGTLLAEAANVGIGYVLIRFLPRAGNLRGPLIRTGCAITTVFVLALVLLFFVIGSFVESLHAFIQPIDHLIYVLCFAISVELYTITDNLFLALGRRKALLVRSIALMIGRFGLLVLFMSLREYTLGQLVLSYILPPLVVSFSSMVILKQTFTEGLKQSLFLTWSQIKVYKNYAIQNYAGNIIAAILPNIMPLLVVMRFGPVESARYGAMWTVANLVVLVPTAVSLTSFAIASRGESQSRDILWNGIRLITMIAFPIILTLMVLSSRLFSLLGPAYANIDNRYLLPLLLSSLCASYLGQFYARARLTITGSRIIIFGQATQAILVLAVSVLLGEFIGLLGFTYAWLIGSFLVLMLIWLLNKQRPIWFDEIARDSRAVP